MTTAQATANGNDSVRYKRRLRNYLLDAGLQLRYTALIVGVAALLTAGLGYMIYQATRDTSRIIEMTGLVDPVTAEIMKEEFAAKDKMVLWGIVGFGLVLVLSVSAVGILITHKIAGPLFNITRIVDRVRENRLGPPLRNLRKGDELQAFYAGFQEMHESLRRRTDDEIRVLGQAVASLQSGPGRTQDQDVALRDLTALLRDKETSLEP